MVGSLSTTPLPLPSPRRPLGPGDRARHWYENDLGWATVPGEPVRLVVGLRFDVLDVPAEAGRAALRHLGPGSPVAVSGDRMRLLVAAGGAEELPGLLRWLEWDPSALELDLVALGAGTLMEAPPPPDAGPPGARPLPPGRSGSQGAAVWLRPPGSGCEADSSLPTLSAVGGGRDAPDLVRLVDTLATHCHRIRLRRACAQPSQPSTCSRGLVRAPGQPFAFS
ncbi:SCO3374 family protein [Streptomyces kebangsaanensis]|uniref:SCO3374 family protein n=1 Tax=Streptomyces kebangsaanensis TaxID=864058 RepID=UPI00093B6A9B|nr:SCO3374 family protein [Streptomyces kebangsaanensis]